MQRNDIKSDPQNIELFFGRNEFYIPSYQRPYAWQISQCEQLVEDIETHQENFDAGTQDNYFFGAILIAQESGEEHDVTLIDGQQRTTSFMLLLKAVLIKIKSELHKLNDDTLDDAKLIEKLTELKNKIISMIYNLGEDESYSYRKDKYELQKKDTKYFNDSVSELYATDMVTILINENIETIRDQVIKLAHKQKDNKYSNYYKNFRFFHEYCSKLTNTQIRDFTTHLIEYCQVITITSFNTDQAINIFNSLNGTGVPLTPIEVIVSKTTAKAMDRKLFEKNWQNIVKKSDNSPVNLNLLMTHYIFMQLSAQHGSMSRNPGIRAFFAENKTLLNNDVQFTSDLDKLLDIITSFYNTELGQIMTKFNSNFLPFVSSYLFYRNDDAYLSYLLRLSAVLEITDFAYGNSRFKGFLERINLKYSQVDTVSEQELLKEIKQNIVENFNKDDIEQSLTDSGVPNSLIILNEYLYAQEQQIPFDLTTNPDIEHIMPQSGYNRANIIQDANLTDQEEFHEYVEKIGNKILLESEINRGLGDAWFRTKKQNVLSNHGYKGSKYPIAQGLVDYPKDTWNRDDIDQNTKKAAQRITNFIFS
ncbi:DUF262 domain-containing protein [Leuconostoc sp. JNUCC 76]